MKLFNPDSEHEAGFEPIIGGSPSGLLNMSKCRYEWAVKIYKQMMALEWSPAEVNTNGEAKRYLELNEYEKRMYNLAFAQLSFDDAGQADAVQYLNRHITNKVVSAGIHRISYEEVNHSNSYAILLQDTTGNADEVFDLYKSDEMLALKNTWISQMYEMYEDNPYMLATTTQVVEGIVFLGGFVAIFSLGQKMLTSATMVSYIGKDEVNSHLPFFSNVAKAIRRENLVNPDEDVYALVDTAVAMEINWLKYITGGVLGFTEDLITDYVKAIADERLLALGLEKKYNVQKNHLNKLLDSYLKVNDKKTNFFENRPTGYAKASLEMNF